MTTQNTPEDSEIPEPLGTAPAAPSAHPAVRAETEPAAPTIRPSAEPAAPPRPPRAPRLPRAPRAPRARRDELVRHARRAASSLRSSRAAHALRGLVPPRRPHPRPRRSLRRRLLSENLRLLTSALLCVLFGVGFVLLLAGPLTRTDSSETQLALFLILLIVMMAVYSLSFAGLTLWSLTTQPRHRMIAAARLPRARCHVRFYRWYMGRSSAFSEVMQMLMIAVIAALLLIIPPPEVPIAALLALTAAAVATAWVGAVMTFAVEYAAEDAHATAFSLPGTTGADRTIADYVYGAVLIQASSGSSDLTPLTAPARRLVRHHVILAHVTSTIIVTLGVSAVVTAVA